MTGFDRGAWFASSIKPIVRVAPYLRNDRSLIVPALQRGTLPAALQRRVFVAGPRACAKRQSPLPIAALANAPLERRKPRHGAGAL